MRRGYCCHSNRAMWACLLTFCYCNALLEHFVNHFCFLTQLELAGQWGVLTGLGHCWCDGKSAALSFPIRVLTMDLCIHGVFTVIWIIIDMLCYLLLLHFVCVCKRKQGERVKVFSCAHVFISRSGFHIVGLMIYPWPFALTFVVFTSFWFCVFLAVFTV